MRNQIVIYKSKRKATIITLVGLLLIMVGWLFLQYPDNAIAGWSFIIFGSICMIFGVGTRLDRKPYLILTENGISEMFSVREEIEWSAIRQADEFFYIGQYFIRLLVDRSYKPDLIQPTWFCRFDRIYAREGVKAIFIRTSFLQISSVKLVRLINKLMKADATERGRILDNVPKNLTSN